LFALACSGLSLTSRKHEPQGDVLRETETRLRAQQETLRSEEAAEEAFLFGQEG
jgi:hypothetical protein